MDSVWCYVNICSSAGVLIYVYICCERSRWRVIFNCFAPFISSTKNQKYAACAWSIYMTLDYIYLTGMWNYLPSVQLWSWLLLFFYLLKFVNCVHSFNVSCDYVSLRDLPSLSSWGNCFCTLYPVCWLQLLTVIHG